MTDFADKLKALVAALPAKLALVQSVLTVVAVEVVPLLPENVGIRVGAVVALALGWVATIVRVVSKVTPVPRSAEGLLLPPNRELHVEFTHEGGQPISGIVSTR